jgi:membrane dipeptidase
MITRRELAKGLGAIALAASSPAVARRLAMPGASSTAAALYRNALVLDCNTLASIGFQLSGPDEAASVQSVRDSGLTALKTTLGGGNSSFEETVADIAAAERLLERHADVFLKARSGADLDRARRQHKVGLIYSFEAASPLADKVERIELFRNLGVRVMQLTYNRRTPFGSGCLDGETDGLTDLGRQAVAKMNELGVALDLSHSNTQTTADGIAASKQPPIFSHTGCRAVYRHPRNKEDREMKALADKGGVLGVYMLPFLAPSPRQPALDDYLAHLEHALQACGEDHVGVGSDVPFQRVTDADLEGMRQDEARRQAAGIAAPEEDRPPYIPDLNTPRKMETIAATMLRRGHPARVVEKVLGANFRRVFGEIWTV